MGCIKVREGDGVVSVFDLDGCGAPELSATGRLAISDVSEITWQDTVDEGQQVTERNFGGRKCYTATGADELQNIEVNITTCGIIPALDTFLMNSNAVTSGGVTTGFGRRDLDPDANVAIEILIQLDADSCTDGSGSAPKLGVLFPRVKNWKPNGTTSLNGSDLVKPQYTGKGFQNANLATGGDMPQRLEHWEGVWDAEDWYTVNVFDGDDVDLPVASCDPLPFVSVS